MGHNWTVGKPGGTYLVIIHAEQFCLLASAELKTRDIVDDEGKDQAHRKGICGDGNNVGRLDVKLPEVTVQPAAIDDPGVDAVKANYVICAKEAVEEEPEH